MIIPRQTLKTLILKRLKHHFLNSAEWHRRRAISLDHWVNEEGYDEGAHPVLIRLSKERSIDTTVILELIEESVPEPDELEFEYTQTNTKKNQQNQKKRKHKTKTKKLAV